MLRKRLTHVEPFFRAGSSSGVVSEGVAYDVWENALVGDTVGSLLATSTHASLGTTSEK